MSKQQPSWCAYNVLPPAKLTKSGLLSHLQDEVETSFAPNVELRIPTPLPLHSDLLLLHDVMLIHNSSTCNSDNDNVISSNENKHNNQGCCDCMYIDRSGNDLVMIVTTHRIVLIRSSSTCTCCSHSTCNGVCAQTKEGRAIDLMEVQNVESAPSSAMSALFKSPKIRISLLEYGEVTMVFQEYKLRDKILKEIELSLKRKAWERRKEMGRKRNSTPSGVGVAAIIARNRQKNAEAKAMSRTAFKEYEGLLQMAKDVQRVIERYSATIDRNKQQGNEGKDDIDLNDIEAAKLTGMLQSMGMTNNALAERSAGFILYHEQIARQLAEFLNRGKFIKDKVGGMITLVDVYCLFNRARGTNLISPEDLLSAAPLMKKLELGFLMVSI